MRMKSSCHVFERSSEHFVCMPTLNAPTILTIGYAHHAYVYVPVKKGKSLDFEFMCLRVFFLMWREKDWQMGKCGIWNDVGAIPMSCSNTEDPARKQSSPNIRAILWFKHQQWCRKSGSVLVAQWWAWTAQKELSTDLLVLILHLKDSFGEGQRGSASPAKHL